MSKEHYSKSARGIAEKPEGIQTAEKTKYKKHAKKSDIQIRAAILRLRKKEEAEGYRPRTDNQSPPATENHERGVLIGNRLLGNSNLDQIIMGYSPNFQRGQNGNFYGWIRPDAGVEDDYLVLVGEAAGKYGRAMYVAVVGAKRTARGDIATSLGRGMGLMLDGRNSQELDPEKAVGYNQAYKKLGAEKKFLKSPGTF